MPGRSKSPYRQHYMILLRQPHLVLAIGLASLISRTKGHMLRFSVKSIVEEYYRAINLDIPPPPSPRYYTEINKILKALHLLGVIYDAKIISNHYYYYLKDDSPIWRRKYGEILEAIREILKKRAIYLDTISELVS